MSQLPVRGSAGLLGGGSGGTHSFQRELSPQGGTQQSAQLKAEELLLSESSQCSALGALSRGEGKRGNQRLTQTSAQQDSQARPQRRGGVRSRQRLSGADGAVVAVSCPVHHAPRQPQVRAHLAWPSLASPGWSWLSSRSGLRPGVCCSPCPSPWSSTLCLLLHEQTGAGVQGLCLLSSGLGEWGRKCPELSAYNTAGTLQKSPVQLLNDPLRPGSGLCFQLQVTSRLLQPSGHDVCLVRSREVGSRASLPAH